MARLTVVPEVRNRLEIYLNEREVAYQAQPHRQRIPTLPATPDGKINVRAVAQAIDLRATQEKYLYERPELSQLINLMAEGQGLLPIGSRLVQAAGDKALETRLFKQLQIAKSASAAALEAQSVNAELMERLQVAISEVEELRAENMRLRTQLDSIYGGMFVAINE